MEVLAGTSGLRINKLKRPGFSYVHPLLMEQIASAVSCHWRKLDVFSLKAQS